MAGASYPGRATYNATQVNQGSRMGRDNFTTPTAPQSAWELQPSAGQSKFRTVHVDLDQGRRPAHAAPNLSGSTPGDLPSQSARANSKLRASCPAGGLATTNFKKVRSDVNLNERNESPDAAKRTLARPRFDQAQFKVGGDVEDGMAGLRISGQQHAYVPQLQDQAAHERMQSSGNAYNISPI